MPCPARINGRLLTKSRERKKASRRARRTGSAKRLAGHANGRRPGAVVIGGDCGALGVVRSLGRAGIPCFFLRGKNPLAGFSRYTTHRSTWPGPEHSDAASWLMDLADRRGLHGWTLFPNADDEVRLISQHHAELSSAFRLCTPPWEITKWLADKNLTYEKAAALGIDYPRTYALTDLADLAALDCRFPLILKPAIKQGQNLLTQSKVWRVSDRDVLRRVFNDAVSMAGPGGLIVQELVPGDGSAQFSYAAVCQAGLPVISMVARRTRQHPADFGTGTFVETIDNAQVEAQARTAAEGRRLQRYGRDGIQAGRPRRLIQIARCESASLDLELSRDSGWRGLPLDDVAASPRRNLAAHARPIRRGLDVFLAGLA